MNEFQMREAFAALKGRIGVPPPDPNQEAALLAAFDAHWTRPARRHGAWVWMSATAASLTLAAALVWMAAANVRTVAEQRRTAPAAADAASFVAWPGADTLPRFESGTLMRVDLPVSVLPALGFAPPQSGSRSVEADLIVGQDGMARAVRLVQQ